MKKLTRKQVEKYSYCRRHVGGCNKCKFNAEHCNAEHCDVLPDEEIGDLAIETLKDAWREIDELKEVDKVDMVNAFLLSHIRYLEEELRLYKENVNEQW